MADPTTQHDPEPIQFSFISYARPTLISPFHLCGDLPTGPPSNIKIFLMQALSPAHHEHLYFTVRLPEP
jgi:hypothetical protein